MSKRRAAWVVLLLLIPVVLSGQDLPPGESPPPDVFDRVKNAGDSERHENAPYAIVMDSSVNRVNEMGISYIDNYMLYKALTDEGCKRLAVISRGYEPMSSIIEFREINIIRDTLKIPVSLDLVKDLPAPQAGIYWGDRIKVIQMPRLEINDGIEIVTFRKGYSYALLDSEGVPPEDEKYIPPMPGEYFDIVLFEAEVPIVAKKYVLKIPAQKRIHSQIYNGPMYSATTYTEDTTIYSWWVEGMPARKRERSTPDASDITTKVVLATVESWEAKSRWFFEVNERQFEVTPAIQAKVDEILNSQGVFNGTEEEKAFALLHWVAQNIRYSGQTMGEGEGFTLHSGEMIFEQRSGVCKDIAGMLVTMMRAAGLDSYAAMTMAGSRIEQVPADQFNHCVVALKKKDGSYVMYDPTWVPFNRTIWSLYEAEQHYLVGSPEGEGLDSIYYSPPEESPMRIVNDASILSDGTLEGTLRLSAGGSMDSYLRGLLAWYPKRQTENALAKLFSTVSDRIEILEYEHGEVLDFNQDMWWNIKYRVPDYAMMVGDGIEFQSPMLKLSAFNRLLFRIGAEPWPEKREADLFLYTTQLLDATENIRLPGDYKVINAEDSDKIDETYAYYHSDVETKGNEFTLKTIGKIKRRQIPPEGYGGFYKMTKEAHDFAETVFRAEKGGAK